MTYLASGKAKSIVGRWRVGAVPANGGVPPARSPRSAHFMRAGLLCAGALTGCDAILGLTNPVFVSTDAGAPLVAPAPPEAGSDASSAATTDASSSVDGGTLITPPTDAGLSAYARAVLSDSPIAYWRLDEASGAVAKDLSGHGHDGLYQGACTRGQPGAIKGDSDTAVLFDGASCLVTALPTTDFAFSGAVSMTIEGWVKPVQNNYGYLFAAEANGSSGRTGTGLLLYAGSLAADRFGGGGGYYSRSGSAPNGTYSHLVVVYDGQSWTLYVNGNVVYQVADSTKCDRVSVNPTIGALDLGSPTAYLNGVIDEVAVYSSPLSLGRIRVHYAAAIE